MANGIIVIDGADCAGKTTLANYFRDKYKAEIIHAGMTDEPFNLFYKNLTDAIALSDTKLVVLDRLWLSESAYGTVYRDGSRCPISSRCIDRLLIKHGAVNIVAIPEDIDAHIANHSKLSQQRYEEFSDISGVVNWYAALKGGENADGVQINSSHNCYGNQYTRYKNILAREDYIEYDYMVHGQRLDIFALRVLERLELLRKGQWDKLLDPCYFDVVGHTHLANTIFVGQELSDKTKWPYPFIWDESDSAAQYFNSMLHAGGFVETRALWVNAKNDTNALADLCRYLYKTGRNMDYKIICLGNVAVDAVQKLGGLHPEWIFRDVVKIRHPSYVKRFDSGKDEKYLAEICRAVAA